MKISPILYMGKKKKLIKLGLLGLFPNAINKFIDAFAGSAIVSMNVISKEYIINDIDNTLHSYYKMFKNHNEREIIAHINKRINEFGLPIKSTDRRNANKEEIKKFKIAYHNFRDFYNKNKTPLDLYTLMFFAFSQQFRVNKNGDFNMPFGNNCFSSKNEEVISIGCEFFIKENISVYKKDFQELFSEIVVNADDFVYLDPPYSITTATYNENKWNSNDDQRLLDICLELNKNNIKFGMSNMFVNNNLINKNLIDFCHKNNFTVYVLDGFRYTACGKGSKQQQEVYICNYSPKNVPPLFKTFRQKSQLL